MSDLNLSITAEEQSILEEKLATIMGGGIINSYGAVSSELVSVLLTAQQKPRNIEEMLATQEVYGNAVKKLFGVDQSIIDIEKVKAYNHIKSVVDQFEQQMAAQEAQAQMMEEAVPEVVGGEAVATDVDAVVEKVAEATAVAEESVGKAEKVRQLLPKKKAPAKKAPAKKSTKSISNTKNN